MSIVTMEPVVETKNNNEIMELKKQIEELKSLISSKEKDVTKTVTYEDNLAKVKEEEFNKEQLRKEIALDDFFNDPALYHYTEEEKRAFTGLTKEETELANMKYLYGNKKVLEHLSREQLRRMDDVFKNGSTKEKLDFKFDFLESYKEGLDKFNKFNHEKEIELGVELSKKGYQQKNNDNVFDVNSIKTPNLRRSYVILKERGII